MTEYHKIQSIYKRDITSKHKTLLEGQWTLPEFEYLAGNVWTFTEKVDGTNIRVIFKDGGITFGGRTEDAQIPAQLVGRAGFLPPMTMAGLKRTRTALRPGGKRLCCTGAILTRMYNGKLSGAHDDAGSE